MSAQYKRRSLGRENQLVDLAWGAAVKKAKSDAQADIL